MTCGLTAENQRICEACAIHCHTAHKLVYIGMKEFACECLLVNLECKAPSCPEISSDGLCNRVKFGKNAIFPAFICESCDKDGKNRICKSCALNCHKGHDVHFLEFSNFECQCNPCKCNENKS